MRLTANFSRAEFDCKDGTQVPERFIPNVRKLAEQLQALRDHIKEPVMITGSGYRTPEHNRRVGGATNSQHLTASGADINARNYTPRQLANVIEKLIREGKMMQGGIGVYKGFVHYDIRGTRARW
jgi:uncharacterized protein YcbK (DUF882 family)